MTYEQKLKLERGQILKKKECGGHESAITSIDARKESFIIASAIADFYFRPAGALPFNPKKPTKRQIQQLRHFAEQGVKVRLK